MLSRGRGNAIRGGALKKATALPNLAVAGKRETRDQPETSGRRAPRGAKRGRERGAGRGARGRSGGNRDANKPVFIEQLGIFSSGLNDDGRHDRSKTDDYNEFSVVNFGRGKRTGRSDDDSRMSGDIKPTTFENEWLSDEEADNMELADLLKDTFIADLRRGTVMPLVLPFSEEPQFEELVSRGVKKEEIDFDSEQMDAETPSENEVQNEKKKIRRRIESESNSEEAVKGEEMKFAPSDEPLVASSQKVASILLRLEQEPSDDLLLVQLPSTLLALSQRTDETNEQSMNAASTAAAKTEGKPPSPAHCLDKFDDGMRIGKLRIRKSGRVELVVGGMALDVTCGIAARHNESVVLIETASGQTTKEDPNALGIKPEPMGDMQEPSSSDKLFVIGKVSNSLVCSHDFAKSIEEKKTERREKAALSKSSSFKQTEFDDGDPETAKLLDDLRSMELREKSWSKWTTNYSSSVESMELDESS